MAIAATRATSGRNTLFSKAFQRYLVSKEYLSAQQATDIETTLMTMENPTSLPTYLLENDYVDEEKLAKALSDHYAIPYISISDYEIDPSILESVDEETARKYHVIPLDRTDSQLTVALADPDNILLLDEIKIRTRAKEVQTVISLPREIDAAIDKYYGGNDTQDTLESYSSMLDGLDEDDIEVVQAEEEDTELDDGDTAPVIRLVNMLVSEAIRSDTSDIHIEPEEKSIRVRYRIDGTLKEMPGIPKKMQSAVVCRIKIISELDIAERRKPQDGRFRMKVDNRTVDFRVSILPTVHGEKVVMRLLDKGNLQLDLTKLGFEVQALEKFEKAIKRPFGMIIVTGPTGSGKSTTLYSALSRINDPAKNIVTVEDPVEYQLAGINQVQTRPEIGMDFGDVLKSFLRQDPDVIMLGEIRDYTTASIAIKSALTGHLVLSTLHTNDAPSSVNRLIDMQIEPFLVGASVILVVAQRLARRICPKCKNSFEPTPDLLADLSMDIEKASELLFYEGKGCTGCNDTGYKGRVALYEVMEMCDALSDGAIQRVSNQEMTQLARQSGMKTLRDGGIQKIIEGLTTVSEVLSITFEN